MLRTRQTEATLAALPLCRSHLEQPLASPAGMAPQKQRGIFVTTLDSDKVKGFNNLELQETDVPQLKDGQVRQCSHADACPAADRRVHLGTMRIPSYVPAWPTARLSGIPDVFQLQVAAMRQA